ncbi:hypothetical protein C8R43DRAFT_614621 [Mycena crocata]|nr:hypothetical protein C8R43DRAFT_614621 [Mycena crocata]
MFLPNVRPRALGNDQSQPASFPVSTWVRLSTSLHYKSISIYFFFFLCQAPIAVVVGVLALLAILVCTRKKFRARIASMGSGVAVASGMPVTRELTAEQLAGSINRAPAAPARTRRPRRTPSQISTISLPAYMKEPGEQELVVSRGPDGEDVVMPAASAADDDDQSHEDHNGDNESGEGHSEQRRHSSAQDNARYSPMPHTPNDSPLLGPDPRGDAPAYFEVVDQVDENYPPGISIAPPEPEEAIPQRRSGFFSMFRPAPPPIPIPSASPANDTNRLSLTHTRTRSTTAPSPSPTPSRHRASTSTSTLFSLTRKKSSASLSANNLTSPSLISLASISHPLPHTLVKTEFSALPKGGLTAEQLSLISGTKEGGLGRFGVPWGDAAVRYAHASASTSRVALGEDGEAPPPGWEEVSGLPEASGSSSTAAEVSGLPEASDSSSRAAEASPSSPRDGEASSVPASVARHASTSSARQDTSTVAVPEPTLMVSPPRADSRASGVSAQTFATAEEGDDSEDDEDDVHPEVHVHVQEPTDATVRQGPTDATQPAS